MTVKTNTLRIHYKERFSNQTNKRHIRKILGKHDKENVYLQENAEKFQFLQKFVKKLKRNLRRVNFIFIYLFPL